jgi:hypothetical protein
MQQHISPECLENELARALWEAAKEVIKAKVIGKENE